jgi:hypothetical protein
LTAGRRSPTWMVMVSSPFEGSLGAPQSGMRPEAAQRLVNGISRRVDHHEAALAGAHETV